MEKLGYPDVNDNEAGNALLNPSQSNDISNADTISPGQEDAPIAMKAEQEQMIKQTKKRTESMYSDKVTEESLSNYTKKAQSMNSKACKITFENLNYSVKVKTNRIEKKNGQGDTKNLQILKNCTGFALPGQTCFIMGASGAGKTSLLNRIASRIKSSKGQTMTGEVKLNDKHVLDAKLFAKYSTYVMQDDVLFPYFTVRECFTFAARLKLRCSEEEQDQRVQKLIEDLGLEECCETQIGSVEKKKISGGERKRTSIGVELITDPQIILLDEPTSGLDSFTAVKIVKVLKQLARDKGKTIMATIHQPSSEAFLNFDRLILMADGHIVYQGIATESAAYFNMRASKSKNLNPCDFFMRELAINYPKTKDDEERLDKYLSKYSKTNLPVIQTQMKAVKFGNLDIAGEDFKPVSMYKQYQLLFYRTLIFNKREPAAVLVKFFQQIFFGLITLLLWQNCGGDTAEDIANMEGCIYQLCVGQMMGWLFGTILTFQIERPVFLREQAANLYAVTPYFLSKQVVEFPASILAPLVQVLMVFWVVGMIKFLETTLAVLLVSQNAIGMGFWISAMASNQQTATAIAPALTTPMIMFGGLFANSDLLPVWLVWIQYISPIYYANVAISQLQFEGQGATKEAFLGFLGFTLPYWDCILIMFVMAIGWRVLAFISLYSSIEKFQ